MVNAGENTFEITIQGHLDDRWQDWFDRMTLCRGFQDGKPITILTGTADQALLHGMLAQVRDMGLRLLSVRIINGSD